MEILSDILTRPAFFTIENRKCVLLCNKVTVEVLYLDMWRNHYTCDVTLKKSDALKTSTETNQAQFCLISGTAALICWCRVRIEIIYPNRWFYRLITSLFAVRITRATPSWYNSSHPNKEIIYPKQWCYWAIKSLFGIYYFLIHTQYTELWVIYASLREANEYLHMLF
jgi:hypothetical protein